MVAVMAANLKKTGLRLRKPFMSVAPQTNAFIAIKKVSIYAAFSGVELAAAIAGRGTPAGQAVSAGQLSENQVIVASYLRTVNDAPPWMRSKNRQSPVESRATVDTSRSVAVPNSTAHVSR